MSSVDNTSSENEEVSKARVKTLVDAWKTRDPDSWQLGLSKEAMLSTISFDQTQFPTEKDARTSPTGGNNSAVTKQSFAHPELERMMTGHSSIEDARDEQRPGHWRQIKVLTVRAYTNVFRNVRQLVGFAVQAVLLGVIFGLTYFQLPEVDFGV
jgi:hypothetical protein